MPVGADVKERLGALTGVTLHRLLGFNPGNRTRFRHNRLNRLPHDVVVVDETSMVSLSLMARLVEAVRPEARLILVGDPEQLASVEAGAVLGDIVGPASQGICMGEPAREELAAVTGQPIPPNVGEPAPVGDGIVVLRWVHRYAGAIAELAEAIQRGDADAVLSVLQHGDSNVEWIPVDATQPAALEALRGVRRLAVEGGRAVIEAARAGEAARRHSRLWAGSGSCARTGADPKASRHGCSMSRVGSGPTWRDSGSPPERTGTSVGL